VAYFGTRDLTGNNNLRSPMGVLNVTISLIFFQVFHLPSVAVNQTSFNRLKKKLLSEKVSNHEIEELAPYLNG